MLPPTGSGTLQAACQARGTALNRSGTTVNRWPRRAARLAIEANLGRPVDLRFPLIWPDETAWAALRARLSAEFPDHSVFAKW
jgi:hypothetical protein